MSLACMVLFVVVFIYCVVTSKARVKTVLYTLGAIVVVMALCIVLSMAKVITDVNRLGNVAIIAGSLVGIGVAVIQSRRSRALVA